MKTICVIALLFVYSIFYTVNAQSFDWAVKGGLWAYDYGYGTATDAQGNVFVAGKYEDTAKFSGVTLPNQGNHDIFVAKYDPLGTLVWIKTAGGILGDYAHCLTLDNEGNVLIAGEIEMTADFEGIKVQAKSDNDIFIAKYTNAGNLVYVRSAGGYKNDKALGIACDTAGNAYITGQFEASATFENITLTSRGSKDMFIAKYSKNGDFQWVKRGGGEGWDEGKAISVNAVGEVYVAGFFKGAASFVGTNDTWDVNAKSLPNDSVKYDDVFLIRYDVNGNIQWFRRAGSAWDDDAWAVHANNSGKIFITGEFNGDAVFDSTHILYSKGKADIFIACYDNEGTVQWTKQAGGTGVDRARGITSDANSNIYLTGQFNGNALFETTTLAGVDSLEIFVASYTGDGLFRWALKADGIADGDTLGPETGNAICVDNNGHVFVTGSYLQASDFGTTKLSAYTRTDMFLAKIDQSGFTSVTEENTAWSNFNVFPNPVDEIVSLTLSADKKMRCEVSLCNSLGQILYKESFNHPSGTYHKELNFAHIPKGIYFLRLSTDAGIIKSIRKLVVY